MSKSLFCPVAMISHTRGEFEELFMCRNFHSIVRIDNTCTILIGEVSNYKMYDIFVTKYTYNAIELYFKHT